MRILSTVLWVVAGLINAAPALGAFSARRLQAAYGVTVSDPNLAILLQHRAVLFAIVGGLLLIAAFHPPLRAVAAPAGFVSMLAFLVIVWAVGSPNAELQRVAWVDVVGLVALLGAVSIDRAVSGPG